MSDFIALYLTHIIEIAGLTLLFLTIDQLLTSLAKKIFHQLDSDSVLPGIKSLIHIASLICLGLSILKSFDTDITHVVASMGFVGATLALAFRRLLINIISGVLILLQRNIKVGDKIEIVGRIGRVVKIKVRQVELECEEGIIYIPNSIIYSRDILIYKEQI